MLNLFRYNLKKKEISKERYTKDLPYNMDKNFLLNIK